MFNQHVIRESRVRRRKPVSYVMAGCFALASSVVEAQTFTAFQVIGGNTGGLTITANTEYLGHHMGYMMGTMGDLNGKCVLLTVVSLF